MNNEHKSPWALVIIIVVVILFGIFWLTQKPKPIPVAPITNISANKTTPSETPNDLEAAALNIDIPDYSGSQ